MAADFDFEALGLLDGLDGTAREERAELIQWLLDQGFSIEHICGSAAAPLMLPASKVLGDDGHYVSAREVSEASGIELELLQRLHRAIGVEIDDPDAAVLLRADGEAAARAKCFSRARAVRNSRCLRIMPASFPSKSYNFVVRREVRP